MAKDNKKNEFNISENPACSSLNVYCKGKGAGCSVSLYEEGKIVYAKIGYGKAKIEAFYLYVGKGAITDVVFDLSKVYKVYGEKFGSMRNFLEEIFKRTSLPFFYVAEWKNIRTEKNVEALGCPIAGMSVAPFHKYCVWAPPLSDLIKALDCVLGNSFHDLDSNSVNEIITKSYKSAMIPFIVLLSAGTALGLVLLILGIVGTINKVVGWLFGIILLLAGGFCLAACISAYKDIADDFLKCKEDDQFFTADNSQFTRM